MTRAHTGFRNRLSPLALLAFSGVAFGQTAALRITEPAPSKNGTIVTSEPAISLKGTLTSTPGDRRVLWESNRGFSDLATVTNARDGSLEWSTASPVPLRPGINHVRIHALGQAGAAAFANIFYTPQTPLTPPAQGTATLWGNKITYEVIDGKAVYQSDMILGPAKEVGTGHLAGRFGVNRLSGTQQRSATIAPNPLSTTGLWPVVSGVVRVPYENLSGNNAANVNAAIAESNTQLAGILQWVPATGGDTNLVNFNFDPSNTGGGCESSVGMVGGVQDIGGSINCTTGTILHEMGHALGLFHEQSRSDRNTYVNYLEQNIDKPQHGNFDVYGSGVDSGLYNYASIMEYGAFEFAKDGVSPVLETIPAGMMLGTNTPQYTTGDLDGILRLYSHAPTSVTVDTNPTGLQVKVDGTLCTAPCVFSSWTVGQQHTLSVPLDGNSQALQTLNSQNYIFGRWNASTAGTQSVTITNSAGDGTLLKPTASPAVTNYLASFIPVHPFTPVVAPGGAGTITSSPPPSTLIIGGNSTPYYIDRQLVTVTVNPNAGFGFYVWYNVPLFNLMSNPYTLTVTSNWDSSFNGQPTTAGLVDTTAFALTTITAASPDVTSANTYPGFAVGILETNNGNATTTANTPQNFYADPGYDGSGFAAGAPISLCGNFYNGSTCTTAAQSPVTTNISYLFNNWSGGTTGGSNPVNVVVPTGHTTYTANYTPSFRGIVLPSASCGGNTVTSSPVGGSPNLGTGNGFVDGFFNIGPVNFTATAGTGMSFFGWSQDLGGTSNPLSFPLAGQVIGTANFNSSEATAPLSVTSISPAIPTATASAMDLAVTGTGFTTDTNTTFTYLLSPNGSFQFRSNTLTSSTQLTIHLQAGDLSTVGYNQIVVLNVGTPGGNTCNPEAFFTFPVANSTVSLASPTIVKAFAQSPIVAGGSTQVTLTLSNSNAIPLTGAAFSDSLSNMTAVGGVVSGSCSGITPASLGAGATSLNFSGITIPANLSCTVAFSVTSSSVGVNPNTTSGVTTTQTPSAGSVSNTANLTVNAPTSPSVAKSFNPSTIVSGANSTVTLNISNPNGTTALTNVSLSDTLINMSVASTTVGGTCSGTTPASLVVGSTSVSFSGISIGTNTACTVTFVVTSTNVASNNNTTSGATSTQTPVAGSPSNTASLTVVTLSAPSITKSFSPSTIQSGATSTVTLNINNPNGIVALSNVSLSDTLVNMTVGATTVGGSCTGTTPSSLIVGATSVSFSGISIPTNSSCTVTFVVTSTNLGNNTNTTSGATSTQTPAAGSPSNTATLLVETAPTISKAFNPSTIPSGGTSVVTLTLSNSNTVAVGGGAFTDTLVNMSAVAGPVTGTCGASPSSLVAGATALSFSGITISGSGSCTVIFSVTSTVAGTWPNTTSGVTTTNTPAPGPVSNSPTLTVSGSSTTTSASNASATFSPANQNVTLNATVASSGGTVNAGTVQFTVSLSGTTIGSPVTSGTVTGGAANATFVLPGGTAAGPYTITAAYSGGGSFAASSDNTHTLTVSGAGSTTAASNASATFSATNQNVTLNATVTSGAGTVNSGTVQFTVSQSGTTIGSPVTSGTVTSGAASATFSLPGGTASAPYTITAAYSGGGNFAASSDNTHTLTVSNAGTTTTASNANASFSASNQNVTLNATVTSPAGTVGAGTVTFTVALSGTTIGSPVTSGTVTSGNASATYVLPGGTAANTYTITAVYNAAGSFNTSSDNTHTLTVGGASTTTTASNASATFGTVNQSVGLSATVTSGAGTVNVGTITFTVSLSGTTIGSPVTSGPVTSGAAGASFVLPANTAPNTYTITAVYNPGTGFNTSSDNTHTLTVSNVNTGTAGSSASASFSSSNQNVTLSATVTSPGNAVNVGTVTFTVSLSGTTIGSPVTSGTVTGGNASATYVLPGGTAPSTYTITAVYNPGTGFNTSSDNTHTLSVGNSGTTTTAANASATFGSINQSVPLSATVTSPGGTVNAGTVTFTVSLSGTTIGSPVTSPTVSSGAASATYVLPGGTAPNTYTITAVYNPGTGFSTSSDNTHTLTVSNANTVTTASNASAPFSASNQNVTLNAVVTSPGNNVNVGTVTFTVSLSGTTIGSPATSGTVTGGNASATFVLPGGTAATAYTITAVYNAGIGFNTSSDNTHTLTVGAGSTTTTASNASATFNANNQNVSLSATVTSGSGTVNAGTVTFTVSQSGTPIGSPVTSGTVTNGSAGATFVLPGGTASGAYTITAAYSGGGSFSASSDNAHTLTVSSANTTTSASNASASFSATNQNVTLNATVTSPAGTVGVGTVTFTVSQSGTTIGSPVTSGTVTSGNASATYVLPGGSAATTYTITAVYNAAGSFNTSSDNTHTLTVGGASTTTSAANASATFNTSNQNVTLSATVTSGAGTVNAGTVTFTVSQSGTTIGSPVTSGTVTSGAAGATFVLPGGTAPNTYTITAVYNAAGGFNTSSDNTHSLTVSAASTTTTAANASATFGTGNQNVSLSATVTSGGGTVNVGTVTFTVSQSGTMIGSPVTSGTVASGSASATFSLPGGTAPNTYTITAVYNAATGFGASSDNTHTLTVSAASTTTTASNASAPFSATNQNVTLNATVTSGAGTVNVGTVTFTVSQSGTTIGSPVTSGTVTGGNASASYVLPGGTAATSYTITAVYNAGTGFTTSSDNTHTLTVGSGATTTTASNASATFNAANRNVTLSATVTSGSGTVNAGTVTFTVSQSGTTIGSPVTSGTVTGGAASVSYVLPGGTAANTYTITAAYSGGGSFSASSDNAHTLTVSNASTTTTASNASATFSASNQNVTLSATVSSGGGTVNAGTVTFTVSQSGTTIGSPVTSATVTAGAASASYVLPGGTAANTYTITAAYSGGGSFSASSDNAHTLTVNKAGTTTAASNASATFSASNQNVTLNATVNSAAGAVNVGTVTFTVSQSGTTIGSPVTSGTVTGGAASATYVLPGGTAVNTYTITAVYNAAGSFNTSSDNTHTLTVSSAGSPPTVVSFSVLFGSTSYNLIGSPRLHLPWMVTGVRVVFSQTITTANMGSLTGVSATGFTGLGTNTLTWTFGGIANSNGALALALSSAIASAGGPLTGPNTSFSIKVLQGDFNDDGFVSVADALLVGGAQSASYNVFADINGDGVVNVADVNLVRSLIGGSNP